MDNDSGFSKVLSIMMALTLLGMTVAFSCSGMAGG